jgi:hypothetical protein
MRNSDLEDQLDYAKIFVGKSHSIGKPASLRLMENVQMQGFRNPKE